MPQFTVCDSFKAEALQGIHQPGDAYKMALFTRNTGASALNELGAATTAFATTVNGKAEITGSGYSTGGITLVKDTDVTTDIFYDGAGVTIRKNAAGHYAGMDWADADFGTVTLTLATTGFYALIYNSTRSNKAVAVGEFFNGEVTSPSGANFKVVLPSSGNVAVKIA